MGRSEGTAWACDERMMWHDPGSIGAGRSERETRFLEPYEHWEHPATKRRLRNLVDGSGLLAKLHPVTVRTARRDELERVHSAAYVDRIGALNETGGDAGEFATFSPGGAELATLAAGTCIAAVDAVLDGAAANAYALVRPTGHHAERERGRGFCIFSNAAIAARHAQVERGIGRVAVVDWDVHHGNGTQDAFYDDPSVLTVSVHQDRSYPLDSGGVDERGEGDGAGFNVNVPLPPGAATEAYLSAFERVVLPALHAFRPGLVLVACGLDAGAMEPGGRMLLHSDSFRELTRMLKAAAGELCDGRLVACHEGGYSAVYVPFCGLAVVEELAGIRTDAADPFLASLQAQGGQGLEPHQRHAIDAAAAGLDLEALAP